MRILVLLSAILLSGCTSLLELQDTGADVADGALSAGAYAVCTASTIGAIRRRYGNSPEQMAAWQLYCEAELSNLEPVAVPVRTQP